MHRTAYVTVTVPVDLVGDTPTSQVKWWRKAAIEELKYHPAISEAEFSLEGYVDKVEFENCTAPNCAVCKEETDEQ